MNISDELFDGIYHAVASYSNVHRGSGHHSLVTTHLFEEARQVILDFLNLDKKEYQVIFCTPLRCENMTRQLAQGTFQVLSSRDIGLSLGVRALVIHRKHLKSLSMVEAGGGTTRLYSRKWVLWANAPEQFEPGTPAIIPIITFARALLLLRHTGMKTIPQNSSKVSEILAADEWNGLSGVALLTSLRQALIGKNEQVPVNSGSMRFINFDNAASTRTFEPVWTAFRQGCGLNQDSSPNLAREVQKICSETLEAPQEEFEIIFTSNTTESINLVANCPGIARMGNSEPVILTTILEHSSNDLPWRRIPGVYIERLKVDKDGFWNPEDLEKILNEYNHEKLHGKKRIHLVAVSGASNVTGACNDLSKVSELSHRYGAFVLADGAQLVPHRKVNCKSTGLDFLAFSAHKAYAPFGTGVLVARRGLLKYPEEELNRIKVSGEENTGGIAALGLALNLLNRIGFETIRNEEEALFTKMIDGMSSVPGLRIVGTGDNNNSRRVGVALFEIKRIMPGTIARTLASERAIGVRYGCHCAHLMIKHLSGFTPLLESIQRLIVTLFPALILQGYVRVSIGLENTEEDVNALLAELKKMSAPDPAPNKRKTFISSAGFRALTDSHIGRIIQRVYSPFKT